MLVTSVGNVTGKRLSVKDFGDYHRKHLLVAPESSSLRMISTGLNQ